MQKKAEVYLLVVAAALFVLGALFIPFLSRKAVAPAAEARVSIGGRVFYVDIAGTPAERARGLSGRDSLGENAGMLFLFDEAGNYSFWMKEMKFPIDIIWIRGNRVLGVTENALPEPASSELKIYYPPGPVDRVLEVSAGAAGKYGIREGDEITFFDIR